jgi:hypothetical protein
MGTWAAWGPTIVAALTMIFVAGKTYGRIGDQENALKHHNDWLREHDGQFVKVDGKIGLLEIQAAHSKAWREGYNAAKTGHQAERDSKLEIDVCG